MTTIDSTHHGLSVYTGTDAAHGADTANNRRLRWPVDEAIYHTFNDATPGKYYDFFSSHQGIDFLCGAGISIAQSGN